MEFGQGLLQQRLIIIAGALVAAIMLAGFIFAGIQLLQRSARLRLSTPSSIPVVSQTFDTSHVDTTGANQVAVEILYRTSPSFSVELGRVSRTADLPTIDHYAPTPGTPYTTLKLLTDTGEVLLEKPFTVATSLILDSVPPLSQPLQAIVEGQQRLVLPVTAEDAPRTVVLASLDGTLLQERTLPSNTLPIDNVVESTLPSPTPEHSNLSLGSLLNCPVAHAQEGGRRFTIAVTNELGASLEELNRVVDELRTVITQVQPWSDFATRIDVVPVFNGQSSLDCTLIHNVYPSCSSDAAMSLINRWVPQWSTILVVQRATNCNCGTIGSNLPPVASIGLNVNTHVLAHMLGHSVGKLSDEYWYRVAVEQPYLGQTCFASEDACRSATARFSDATCAQGCSTVSSWRPSSNIMHHDYTDFGYGSLENCVLGERIAAALGDTYQCPSTTRTLLPSPTPVALLPPEPIAFVEGAESPPIRYLCFAR